MEYESIIHLLKSYTNKFNRILLFKYDFMEKKLVSQIKELSINENDLYFNIIRIYFYNYYNDLKNFKLNMRQKNQLKQPMNNYAQNYAKNFQQNHEKKIVEFDTVFDTVFDKNKIKIGKNDEETEPPEKLLYEDFHIPIEKFINNYNIQFRSDFQKKLFRYIIFKIHPDKQKHNNKHNTLQNDYYAMLCIDVLLWNDDNDIALLYLTATIFGYSKPLTERNVEQLNRNIAKFIRKRQLIK